MPKEDKATYNLMFNALNSLIKANEKLLLKTNKKELVNVLKATIRMSRVAQLELSKNFADKFFLDNLDDYYNQALAIHNDIKKDIVAD